MLSTICGIPIGKVIPDNEGKIDPDFACINLVTNETNLDDKDLWNYSFNQDYLDMGGNPFSFTPEGGKMAPVYDVNRERSVVYLFGPSGSGKSYFANMWLKSYKDVFPGSKIFVFSKLDDDGSLDKGFESDKNYIRINLGNGEQSMQDVKYFLENIKDFHDCCWVFDDIDTITDKDLLKEIRKLRDDALEIGRHNRISVVATSHLGCNNVPTKGMINESHYVVFFPQSGQSKPISYFLSTYAGMDKKKISAILDMDSRWVMLHKHHPQYVLHEDGVDILAKMSNANQDKLIRKIYGH